MSDIVNRVGDIVDVRSNIGRLQRVGDVWRAFSGSVTMYRVGDAKRYHQEGKSKSLRLDRVEIKRLVGLAS